MNKAPRDITEEDIQNLVRLGRSEGPTLEYKAGLYETNDRGNREFLQDVCAMANSQGGYLFVGVSDLRHENRATGVPDQNAVLGLEIDNPEFILSQYEARIVDCIDERLTVESHAVPVAGGRFVLVFRVPNSLSKPHRVHYQGRSPLQRNP